MRTICAAGRGCGRDESLGIEGGPAGPRGGLIHVRWTHADRAGRDWLAARLAGLRPPEDSAGLRATRNRGGPRVQWEGKSRKLGRLDRAEARAEGEKTIGLGTE